MNEAKATHSGDKVNKFLGKSECFSVAAEATRSSVFATAMVTGNPEYLPADFRAS